MLKKKYQEAEYTKAQQMDTIKFSNQWNGKLKCKVFTTIRLKSFKYQIGKTFRIELNGEYIGKATIKGMRILQLNKINEFISLLDAGLEPPQMVNMLKTMYKNKVPNIDTAEFYYILLKWDTELTLDLDGGGKEKANSKETC